MITAIDTNVLLDILVPNQLFCEGAIEAVEDSASSGSLVVCDLVYAELCMHFNARQECDDFLESSEIRVQSFSRETSFQASRAWRTYRQQGGQRTRILADFMIGAHAQIQATRLLSRDRGFYHRLFPSLTVLDPSET
ncbi:MAG TPA: PIN domain-containing protein [Candidatus Saccharimonadales bacterium]|jgi:predicted nucleic acid-binding protein|nr:PIN domain-containing protein [Candidatus Saccharimonadales bacterium]